ncbi:MAG TPA: SPOR domain-containing protein [Spirochaetota bacterium]|nr:SPOR domain-containing protein [Spirochaetota bacterium]
MDMDQFNIPHQKVKEKSVYMLHLDAARIILISAAVIGIIIVSFLLGMNFIKGGDGNKALVTKNDIFDSQKELDLLKNNIPDPADEDDLTKPMDEKLVASGKDEKALEKEKGYHENRAVDKDKKEDLSASSKNESSDMLTGDNFSEPPSRARDIKKKRSRDLDEGKKISRSSDSDLVDKPVKKATVKNDAKKRKRGKSKVVAVSIDKAEEGKTRHPGNYAIQVGSFDKKAKAQSEVRALKDLNYDAYLDESLVKGKQYFRVRIGPIASKKKALDLLKDVQDNEKYQESYMVRD